MATTESKLEREISHHRAAVGCLTHAGERAAAAYFRAKLEALGKRARGEAEAVAAQRALDDTAAAAATPA